MNELRYPEYSSSHFPDYHVLAGIPAADIMQALAGDDYLFGRALGVIQLLNSGVPTADVAGLYLHARQTLESHALALDNGLQAGVVLSAVEHTAHGMQFSMLLNSENPKNFGESEYHVGRFDQTGKPLAEIAATVPTELIEIARWHLATAFDLRLASRLAQGDINPYNVFYLHCGGCYAPLEYITAHGEQAAKPDIALQHLIANRSRICPCCQRMNMSTDAFVEFRDQSDRCHFLFQRVEIKDDEDIAAQNLGEGQFFRYSPLDFCRHSPTFGSWPETFGSRGKPFGDYYLP